MAEKNKYRFKGHESFILREGWLNKGLSEVSKNPKVFAENYGADALGVGPNMAKSIRYWLRAAGLTEESIKTGAVLTEVGRIILEKDPYIEASFTLWLIHCRIAMNEKLATAWNLYFNQFLYEEFDKNQLYEEMRELAKECAGDGAVSEKSVIDDCDAILHMYLPRKEKETNPEEKNVSPFARLGLLRATGDHFERKQPDLNHLPQEVVLYLLAEYLDKQETAGKKSVNLEDLLALHDGPGRILQLKRTALLEILERLAADEKITINRTAGLNMVYFDKHVSGAAMIEAYYKE